MTAPSYNKEEWARIKRYDPALELRWNAELNRWELWRRGKNRMVFIVRLENSDGTFRTLDKRLLNYLVNCDSWTKHNADPTAIHKELLDRERREQAKRDEELYGKLNEISKSQYARNAIQAAF